MTINDLLANLDEQPTNRAVVPSHYKAMFVASSSARVARDWIELLRRLRDEGFEVHVLAADDGGIAKLEGEGILTKVLPGFEEAGLVQLPALAGAFLILQAYLIEHQPTLIHGIGWQSSALTGLATKQLDVPAVFASVEDHRWLTSQSCGSPSAQPWERLQTLLLERSRQTFELGWRGFWSFWSSGVDRYFVSGPQDQDTLLEHTSLDTKQVELSVGQIGFDPARSCLAQVHNKQSARQRLGAPHTKLVIGLAGRLDGAALELVRLVQATADLDVTWLVARPAMWAPSKNRVHAALASLPHVVLVEPGVRMDQFYEALDLFVSLRYSEEPALSLLEAMGSGVPVVTYATRWAQSIVRDGRDGRVVPLGQWEEALKVIHEVYEQPGALESWAASAREHTKEWTRSAKVQRMLESYDTILGQKLGD